MTDTQRNKRPARRPDCVTETRIGNTILVVSGFFKEGATDTAADKMMKVLEAEAAAGYLSCENFQYKLHLLQKYYQYLNPVL